MKNITLKRLIKGIAFLIIFNTIKPCIAQTITNTGTTITLTSIPGLTDNYVYIYSQSIILTTGFNYSAPTTYYSLLEIGPNISPSSGCTLVANGVGTSPYTYSWSPSGATTSSVSASSGSYTCVITDNTGASSTVNYTYTVLSVTATITNPICYGGTGTASATATGGTSPYTYSWSGGGGTNSTATSLTAGTYTITVTDNYSCTAVTSVTITQPASSLGITISSVTNVSCYLGNGDVISNAAIGGVAPYTYSWSPGGGTNLSTIPIGAGTYTITVTDNNGCTSTASATITQPANPLGITINTVTNVNCNGGTGTATANIATGGTSPYTYSWSGGGGTSLTTSNLYAGTYTITVTDNNGCTATASATITQPANPLGITIASINDATCGNDGNVTANSATGGTSPYTYSWSPTGGNSVTAMGLSGGTYTITVTDNHGCTATASATITQPSNSLGITIATVNGVLCNGGSTGSATANAATGGTPPYNYEWSPNASSQTTLAATGLSAGTYTIAVTDGGSCTYTASVTVTQPLALGINMSVANVNCFGINSGTATASPTGGTSPYTYSWSGGGGTNQSTIPIGPGTYTVTVTDNNNCPATASATITQPVSSLGITILSVLNVTGCSSLGSITANVATGGTSPYTYSWSTSPVQTSTTASSLSAGTYTITVTDNHGCTATVSATITQPTGVLGINTSETNVSCYEGSTGTATVTASGGTSPYTYSWSGGEGTNSTANGLLAGTYTITVEDNNACSISVAVIITQPANPLGITINTVTNVSCYGGTGTATANIATGGTSPYTYSWSGGGGTSLTTSNLYAGTYTITVTDNHGCTATISATITQPASVLGISVTSVNNIRCYGGTGTATAAAATGGTSPYTYSWSGGGGANLTTVSVVAGTYTITVEDNHGCTATASSTITQPDELSTTATVTANDCNGGAQGSALADPSGGTTPYTYSWSDGSSQTTISATGLSAGTYTVIVTDNCSATASASVIITQPAIPLIVSTSVTNACGGNNGTATASLNISRTFSYEAAAQNFSVPSGVTTITVTIGGAGGGNIASGTTGGGAGASFSGICTVTPGDILNVVIGQKGTTSTNGRGAGGGGATLIYDSTLVIASGVGSVNPLAVAGGGGGSGYNTGDGGAGGTDLIGNSTTSGTGGSGSGGSGGSGGDAGGTNATNAGAGGAGWTSNGQDDTKTADYAAGGNYEGNIFAKANSGAGTGSSNGYGGFGGGGQGGHEAGGGGGGYNGGGGGDNGIDGGGGGGSYISGTATSTVSIANTSNGFATILYGPGGTSPYTYSWNTTPPQTSLTATGLSTGSYIITVTDYGGCTASAIATVASFTSVATISITQVSPIIYSVTNVVAGADYRWDYTDVSSANYPLGYAYAGLGTTAYLPVWPMSGTLTFYADSNSPCWTFTSVACTSTVSIAGEYSGSNPYPRWSKRGMYVYDDQDFTLEPNTYSDIVSYCWANNITYVCIGNLFSDDYNEAVFDAGDDELENDYSTPFNYALDLSNFINALKTTGGVEQVGVLCQANGGSGMDVDDFQSVVTYNSGSWTVGGPLPWNEKVDVISLDDEFEYESEYTWSNFNTYHLSNLKNMYAAAQQCPKNNLRVEDYVEVPMDNTTFGTGDQPKEIDSICKYSDRILFAEYQSFPSALWAEDIYLPGWQQIGSPGNSFYKKEVWPIFDIASTNTVCLSTECEDPYSGADFLGDSLCRYQATPVWAEQYFYDYLMKYMDLAEWLSVSVPGYPPGGPDGITVTSFTNVPDTNIQILGNVWFQYTCLQNWSFNTNAVTSTDTSTIPYYITVGPDQVWTSGTTPPITITATVHGGQSPFTYTWYNLDNGRIVFYSTAANTYTAYFSDLANNYSESRLGVVVTDGNHNTAADYLCIYEQYTVPTSDRPVVRKTNQSDTQYVAENNENSAKLYPNPNKGEFTIELSVANGQPSLVEVYTMMGQKILNQSLLNTHGNNFVDLNTQANGIYFYRVMTESGNLIGEGKLVIEK